MSKPTWNLDDLEAEVRKLADQRADYVYKKPSTAEACMYIHDNEPGCIFGAALHGLGVTKVVLGECNQIGSIWRVLNYVFGFTDEELSTPQVNWMLDVQRRQDHGVAWGPAVHHVDQANER